MRAVPVGSNAVLVECRDAAEVRAVEAYVRAQRDAGALSALDVVPAARTVLIDGVDDAVALAAELVAVEPRPVAPARGGVIVQIPVRFDGPDLEFVARHWGVAVRDVPAIVCDEVLMVAFCGFAPGFGYLTGAAGTAPWREVPRLSSPRTAVPAGAVALAGEYASVYPSASPGGWRLIGAAVDVAVWDPVRSPAALLAPGVAVRFVDAT